ncbi:MAG TPA: cyclophilin-like fold protein [Nitrososphaera sp.]|nr:cyclophilin-like fold protein [Nitrososphaera sp.]
MQPGDRAGSVSRLRLEIEVSNRGSAACEIVRHLAPITSGSILKNLPLQNRIHRYGDSFVYFETGLVIGAEKQRSRFKRGEIGFMVSNGALCVFLKDAAVQSMNPLGLVTANLEVIESTHPGDVLTLRKITA